jgi:MoaA/NifB/PqqE/SkfB family radical SAM enzyme
VASTASSDASGGPPGAARRLDSDSYVSMTMEFRCNLSCAHCMIEGTMDWLLPQSGDQFEQLLAHNAAHRQWTGLILTGSEITLLHGLPDLARRAHAHGFEHVRIQTHGMRLANSDYCRELVDAGVDEYFVSVTAADAATHDAITGVAGSFERTMQGLENLDALPGVATMTNTVVTAESYRQLPDIVERLAHLRRLTQVEFWVYLPMKERDEKNLIASHLDVRPFLFEAIRRARARGLGVAVKNYPHCLLAEYKDVLDNSQPKLFIDSRFWREFMRNGFDQCMYRDRCSSQECLGLTTAYIVKHGWHEHDLRPLGPLA